MKELKDYTSDELREELKRRRKKELANRPKHVFTYIEIEGKVVDIKPCSYSKSFIQVEYAVKVDDARVNKWDNCRTYKLKNGCFTKNNVPNIGDTVIIGHLLTKARNYFSASEARIMKIVKRKEE